MKAALSIVMLLALGTIARGTLIFDWENDTTGISGTATAEVGSFRLETGLFPLYFLNYYMTIDGLEFGGTWETLGWEEPWPSTNEGARDATGLKGGRFMFGDLVDVTHVPSTNNDLELLISQIPGDFPFVLDGITYTGKNRRYYTPPIQGDLNNDGNVDAADAGIMFGNWTGDIPQHVPEPNAYVALTSCLAITRMLSRRRC